MKTSRLVIVNALLCFTLFAFSPVSSKVENNFSGQFVLNTDNSTLRIFGTEFPDIFNITLHLTVNHTAINWLFVEYYDLSQGRVSGFEVHSPNNYSLNIETGFIDLLFFPASVLSERYISGSYDIIIHNRVEGQQIPLGEDFTLSNPIILLLFLLTNPLIRILIIIGLIAILIRHYIKSKK